LWYNVIREYATHIKTSQNTMSFDHDTLLARTVVKQLSCRSRNKNSCVAVVQRIDMRYLYRRDYFGVVALA